MKSKTAGTSAVLMAITSISTPSTCDGFTHKPTGVRTPFTAIDKKIKQVPSFFRDSSPGRLYNSGDEDQDDEIARLRSMAAQLRAEAATLEADKKKQIAKAAEKAFREFDTNQDGEISVDELKRGLEKLLQTNLPESRVKDLMTAFDASGDGALQLDEFVGVDVFRNKLEALAREEKEAAKQAELEAKLEQEAAALAEARLNFLNEKEPTSSDKIFSVLPYLFPLFDGLQYGRFIFNDNSDNPIVILLAVIYTLYKNIPFSGFAAFLALNFLSNNPNVNRLVRYNMQQAIFVDIALFFPGLVSGIFMAGLKAFGTTTPPAFSEIFSDVIFVTLIVSLAYCSVSSLLGVEPNKLPFISNAVTDRMPTIDMFDEEGRFIPQREREEDEDKNDEK